MRRSGNLGAFGQSCLVDLDFV